MEVHVAPIDPRDQSWEVPQPAYRVYFHNARGASYEYEVSGADVRSVLEWAEAEKGDRTYVLYACAMKRTRAASAPGTRSERKCSRSLKAADPDVWTPCLAPL